MAGKGWEVFLVLKNEKGGESYGTILYITNGRDISQNVSGQSYVLVANVMALYYTV